MKELLESLGIQTSAIVAGLVGSVAALSIMPPPTFKQVVATLIGGIGCAAYVTPFAVEIAEYYLEDVSRNLENGMAFALGVAGMNVIAGVMKLARNWREKPTLDPRDIGRRDDD